MKKLTILVLVALTALTFTSCQKEITCTCDHSDTANKSLVATMWYYEAQNSEQNLREMYLSFLSENTGQIDMRWENFAEINTFSYFYDGKNLRMLLKGISPIPAELNGDKLTINMDGSFTLTRIDNWE